MPRDNKDSGRKRGFGYIGHISNSGAQRVVAPIASDGKKGTSTVKTGNDLRTK